VIRALLKTSSDILLLYASKLGAMFVGLYVLPIYREILGGYTFGVVAVIFSIQTFLITFDFGVSTIVMRDLASDKTKSSCREIVLGGQLVLHFVYILVWLIGCLVVKMVSLRISVIEYSLVTLFFWAMTIQNVNHSALMAQKYYARSSIYQIVGTALRAAFTLTVLRFCGANLTVFLIGQSLIAVVHAYMTTRACCNERTPLAQIVKQNKIAQSAFSVLKRGRHLIVFSLAGAAVMQLDKVLLSSTNPPETITPYFLASVFCLTPISVFGGPLNQFFQPIIINCISNQNGFAFRRQLIYLTTSIILIVMVPSIVMWLGRETLLYIWLRQPEEVGIISRYVKILLPGLAFGALGYIPFTILTACQDFRWQARASAVMTVVTLILTGVAALYHSIETVCWIYAGYHVISTVVTGVRAGVFLRLIFVDFKPHPYI